MTFIPLSSDEFNSSTRDFINSGLEKKLLGLNHQYKHFTQVK